MFEVARDATRNFPCQFPIVTSMSKLMAYLVNKTDFHILSKDFTTQSSLIELITFNKPFRVNIIHFRLHATLHAVGTGSESIDNAVRRSRQSRDSRKFE